MRSGIYLNDKEKQKQRRILKLKIFGGLAVFFVLIIGIGYLVVYSPAFRIIRIDIALISADKTRINTDEIVKDLKFFFTNQSKISQFLGQDNILIWKKEKIRKFISAEGGSASGGKNYFQIAELTIEKKYLERRIKINIKEREKFGIWCQQTRNYAEQDAELRGNSPLESVSSSRESVCWWFDKTGIIFSEALMAEGQLINKVNDFSGRLLKLGEPILEEKFAKNIFKIFEILEKSALKIKSLKLENLAFQEIIADSSNLPKIYFSLRFNPEFALTALESFKKIGLNKIEYIDLRVENRAYYKLK
ncbi:MAG: hypothetical protein AAB696_02200 [Patescibacteria group bacterium]